MIPSNLLLNCSPCEEENLNTLDLKTPQLTSKIHSLLTLMVGLLTCQVILENQILWWKEILGLNYTKEGNKRIVSS